MRDADLQPDHLAALADDRQRQTLALLAAHRDLTLADLAEAVAEREADADIQAIDPEAVQNCYLSLYHTQVPHLTELGLVDYEQERDLLRLTDAGQALAERALDDGGASTE